MFSNITYTILLLIGSLNLCLAQYTKVATSVEITTPFWIEGEVFSKRDTTRIGWGSDGTKMLLSGNVLSKTSMRSIFPERKGNVKFELVLADLTTLDMFYTLKAENYQVNIDLNLIDIAPNILESMEAKDKSEKPFKLIARNLNKKETIAGTSCDWYAITPADKQDDLNFCIAPELDMNLNSLVNSIAKGINREGQASADLPKGAPLAIQDPNGGLIYKAREVSGKRNVKFQNSTTIDHDED